MQAELERRITRTVGGCTKIEDGFEKLVIGRAVSMAYPLTRSRNRCHGGHDRECLGWDMEFAG